MQVSPSSKENIIELSETEKQTACPSSLQSHAAQELAQSIISDASHDLEGGATVIDHHVTEIRLRNQRDALVGVAGNSANTHILNTVLIIIGIFGLFVAGIGTGLQEGGKASNNPKMQWSGTGLIAAGLFLAAVTGVTGGVRGVLMARTLRNQIQAQSAP